MKLDPDLSGLESESIHILRETAADFEHPVLLYSVGKDSSVLLRLAERAFAPAPMPFPLLHIDTGFKFAEMLTFRNAAAVRAGARLIVHRNEAAIAAGANPFALGLGRCCSLLKTAALLDALNQHGFTAAVGGARREEERSRAKERVFSRRDRNGAWDARRQRPELWALYNGRLAAGETMRVFPLSNWTELDVWRYIGARRIPVVPLYFAAVREVLVRGRLLIPTEHDPPRQGGEQVRRVLCRMRTLGCTYCTGAIQSSAASVSEIIHELQVTDRSERENRLIDHGQEGGMEAKKLEGYF
ncbi:MAG: sulfate adenylyltransferase subunit CysD [Terriglobales bacterium]